MKDPRVPLKNPIVAAILAFLLPGAGHWYQGRRFKATIYSGCILTMFFWGMILGNGQPVYSQLVYRSMQESPQLERVTPPMKFSFAYSAQVLVGLPALPSLVQEYRFRNEEAQINFLSDTIISDFEGMLTVIEEGDEKTRPVKGEIEISPVNPDGGNVIQGVLRTIPDADGPSDGKMEEVHLGSDITIGREIFGSPRRFIRCRVAGKNGELTGDKLEGTVTRSFVNWFQAPRDTHELDRLHGTLNRQFDLACVFTWIAGLLNLLAIWDAADGPAYGYGDEKPEDDEDDSDENQKQSPTAKS